MPSKSPEQHRLMEAVAHTPGGLKGIPQAVGKEFVSADVGTVEATPEVMEQNTDKSAGIVFICNETFLLVKRGNGGDYPNHWAFPGGHIKVGETAEQGAT